MNIPRRVVALKRDVYRHEEEIERVANLKAAGDEFVLALPQFVDKYLADIRVRIAELRAEIGQLESED